MDVSVGAQKQPYLDALESVFDERVTRVQVSANKGALPTFRVGEYVMVASVNKGGELSV